MNLEKCIADTGLIVDHGEWSMNQRIVEDFERLKGAAQAEGIQLAIISAFRSYEKQKTIWDAKARGERPVYDDRSRLIDMSELDDLEKLLAIFRWTALPGLSRHHWGTDLDVYDAAAVDQKYQLQLLPQEYSETGPFNKLSLWLQSNIERFGFFFPYDQDRGGVAPEPWHISHREISDKCLKEITADSVCRVWQENPFELSEVAIANVDMILDRFVFNIGSR